MKTLISTIAIGILCSASAMATPIIGVGIEGAQSNCNIAMLGTGTIQNCSFNANGTVTCDCEANSPAEVQASSCSSAIGVGYGGVQSNCTIESGGQGQISNCSFNPNGTVVCSCCW